MSKPENPHILSHRYQILGDLGEGGIGKVYRAFDRWTGKDIAVKALFADMGNPALVESFKNEFILLSQLKHPGVVEAFDFGYINPTDAKAVPLPYFTMEFVEGKSLLECFSGFFEPDKSVIEFERFYPLIRQICDILEFLHLRGLVHCDLKPDNLKITDRIFRPKLLDFGLTEKIGSIRIKETKGTLPYMAPEMFKPEPLDERTDLYSLGIILYELVTSRLPFSSDDPVKIVSAHLQEKPIPPSEINPHLPSFINELITKLLEKSPSDRPQDASQVKQILEQGFLGNLEKEMKLDHPYAINFLSHLYSGPLVGRETESHLLEDYLKRATSLHGGCVLVSGEQGVGKTLLLQDLKVTCQLKGITVVDSNCLQDQTIAYQPLIDIWRKLVPYVENKCPAQFVQNFKDIFRKSKEGSFFSTEAVPGSTLTGTAEAQAVFHQTVYNLLVDISQTIPFVMIIDNLQWADSSTLQFLVYCQLQKSKGKIFWCGAFREEKLKENAPLQALLDVGSKESEVCCLKLARFDLSHTKNLISSKLTRNKFSEEFYSYVHQRTSGNPYFVVEVLKYLMETKVVIFKDSFWTADIDELNKCAIPDTIESVLIQNLERYDDRIIDFLSPIAVTGKRFSLSLIQELNLFDSKTVSDILTTLTNDRLLIRKDEYANERTYYEFANQSLQTLLYRRMKKDKRIFWHRKVGELLEKQSSDEGEESIFEIAHHFSEAREYEKAYKYDILSAEEMERRFANQEVLGYLDKALKLTPRFSDRQIAKEKRVLALTKKADFCKKVGELNQAEGEYKAVLRLIQNSSDLKMLVKTYNNLAEIYRLKHDYQRGIYVLKKAMHIHERLDDPVEHANTLSYLGLLYWTDSQYQNALSSFRKALEIDQKQDNKSYRASTLNNMGLVYWSLHQYSDALKYFTEALSVYKDLENQEWIARTQNNLGATLLFLGEFPQALDHLLKSLELNKKITNHKEASYNLENIGEVYRKMGDYTNAFKYWEQGLNLALEINFTQRAGYIFTDLGITHFELGFYRKALEYYRQAKETAEKIEDKELQILVLLNLSKFFVSLNDDPKAAQYLEEAAELSKSINDQKSLITIYQINSKLMRKGERIEEAIRLLEKASALAKKLNAGEEFLSVSLEIAEQFLDQGEVEKAEESIELIRNSGLNRYLLYHPYFYLISGKSKWIRGDSKLAKNDLETALKLAETLNHHEISWRIHHHLGKLAFTAHDVETAYRELESAVGILKKLSENIKDEDLRQSYLKDPEKTKLLSDLKKTAKELIGETKMV